MEKNAYFRVENKDDGMFLKIIPEEGGAPVSINDIMYSALSAYGAVPYIKLSLSERKAQPSSLTKSESATTTTDACGLETYINGGMPSSVFMSSCI